MSSTDNQDNNSSREQDVDTSRVQEVVNMIFLKFGQLGRLIEAQDEITYEDEPLVEIAMYISLYFGQCVADPSTKCSNAGLKSYLKHVLTEHDNLPNNDNTEN